MDKIMADRQFAIDVLKVDCTPTFFINGEMIKGEVAFEEFEKTHQIAVENLIRAHGFIRLP